MHVVASELAAVAGLDDEVSALASALAAHPELFDELEALRVSTQPFGDPEFRDFRDLVDRLAALPSLPAEVATAANALAAGLTAAVIRARSQASHPMAHGLSICLPPRGAGIDCAYRDADALWSGATSWDELLVSFTLAHCGP